MVLDVNKNPTKKGIKVKFFPTNADGMVLNSQYDEVYVIVKYNGDPTPITGITVTFS
jgi:hypothetical protein